MIPQRFLIASLLVGLGCTSLGETAMTRERLERIISESAEEVEGQPGAIRFVFDGVPMTCVSDLEHDRMRIIAPVAETRSLDPSLLAAMLVANFHTALDGRYAASEGVVYAAYIHPLSSLDRAQVESALRQVAGLKQTFGSTFSSGELLYGGGERPEGEPL